MTDKPRRECGGAVKQTADIKGREQAGATAKDTWAMSELNREQLGMKIYEVARNHADAYERALTSFSTEQEKDVAKKCACAASNTGYFLLQALGYEKSEMDRFHRKFAKQDQ